MISVVLGVVAVSLSTCQALPTFHNQVQEIRRREVTEENDVTSELNSVKEEFMQELDQVVQGLVADVTGQHLEDTPEVKQVKAEFMVVFDNALNGLIKKVFLEDTAEVKKAKEEFFKVFDAATNGLLVTIDNLYIEDTKEVKDAKDLFYIAFEDAKAGRIGAQYIAYTPEVQKARDEFFRFFDLVLSGMLYKLAPQPVHNNYIPDTDDVNAAKKQFLTLYKSALNGDLEASLTVSALEQAIRSNEDDPERAAEEFLQTATSLEEMIKILEGDGLGSKPIQTKEAREKSAASESNVKRIEKVEIDISTEKEAEAVSATTPSQTFSAPLTEAPEEDETAPLTEATEEDETAPLTEATEEDETADLENTVELEKLQKEIDDVFDELADQINENTTEENSIEDSIL